MPAVDVDDAWQRFAKKQNYQSSSQPTGMHAKTRFSNLQFSIFNYQFGKIVASFIGVLLVSGIAFAAIHIVRHYVEQDMPTPPQETQMVEPHQQIIPDDTVKVETTDTIAPKATMEPVVFDNVPLEEMLPEIAAHYDATVTFGNDNARQLASAIQSLTPTEQQLFRMRHELEMDIPQIAAVTGLLPRSVSQVVSVARRKIVEQLKKGGIL